MKPSPSDRVEIIRLVEESRLPARRQLEILGIARSSFYRWYDRYQQGGPEALADRPSRPDRVWNRIPDVVREQIIDMALDCPELSPRELAVRFTDEKRYFVSEASVYRLLKLACCRFRGHQVKVFYEAGGWLWRGAFSVVSSR